MSGSVRRQAIGPNTWARQRRRDRQRRAVVTAIVGALLLATFVLVTGQVGFPGPGPLRRYPTRELQALADQINRVDCGGSQVWPELQVHLVEALDQDRLPLPLARLAAKLLEATARQGPRRGEG